MFHDLRIVLLKSYQFSPDASAEDTYKHACEYHSYQTQEGVQDDVQYASGFGGGEGGGHCGPEVVPENGQEALSVLVEPEGQHKQGNDEHGAKHGSYKQFYHARGAVGHSAVQPVAESLFKGSLFHLCTYFLATGDKRSDKF